MGGGGAPKQKNAHVVKNYGEVKLNSIDTI
jgi:hypothetical protein